MVESDASLSSFDLAENFLNAKSLDVRESTALDYVGELVGRYLCDLVPGLEPFLQRRERSTGIDVTRVLREHRPHEFVEGIPTRRQNLVVLLLPQTRVDCPDATSGDGQPCGPRAIEANFVYWFMNARCTVPVGPFLCLATISSASPFASESWL